MSESIGGSQGGSKGKTVDVGDVTLEVGEMIRSRRWIPTGTTLKVDTVGVLNSSNMVPSGLSADVVDETNSTTLVSESSKRATVSTSVDGPVAVAFTIVNNSSSQQVVSAFFDVTED